MKHFGTKPLRLALVAAALILSISSQAYGYRISVYPDTLTMTAAVGSSTTAYIAILDGRDTMQQNQTPGTVFVSFSGSSQFTMLTDSILSFVGETVIEVRYTPTSGNASYGGLTIHGDSNTVFVPLIGNPLSHTAPQLSVGNYDSVVINQQACQDFSIYNTNADTITVTQITLTDDPRPGTQWTLANLVSLPMAIAPHARVTLGEICAMIGLTDSGFINGQVTVSYSYGSGSDQVEANLYGQGIPINADCIHASNGDFGGVAEGASSTNTITLTNTTDSSIYIDSPQLIGNSEFTITSNPFPASVAAGQSVNLVVSFTAPNNPQLNYGAVLQATIHGTSPDGVPCNSLYVPLSANVWIPVSDSITLDVPPGTTSLSISAHSAISRHAIFINNVGSNLILLQSLAASTTDTSVVYAYFGTYGETATSIYDSLGAGQHTGMNGPILLTLQAADTGTYNLDLTLTYEVMQAHKNGFVPASNSLTYTVIAHRLPLLTESVSEPNAQPTEFTLSPNPARDEVTIGLPDNGSSSVEIYDVLGNLVMSRVAQGEFVWNAESSAGTLANGTYIVRVSQGDHTSSKRLVIVR